jgi:hypothetical protein
LKSRHNYCSSIKVKNKIEQIGTTALSTAKSNQKTTKPQ